MSIQPNDDPAMTDAAGRDEAADGIADMEPSLAEGAADAPGDERERPTAP